MGSTARLIFGSLLVVLIGYIGLVFAPSMDFASFWPYAGVWAAIGWGASRASLRPVIALILLGLVIDLTVDAPVGCWPAIHLVAYLVSSIFRKRALTDVSGFVRLAGDVAALAISFVFANWVMSAYLGGVSTHEIVGGYLTTGLLYLAVRPMFLLSRNDRVDA